MKIFYEIYKSWRNTVRNYSTESIIYIALNFLQQKVSSKFDDIKRAPWQVLLIVKWVCQDQYALGRKQIFSNEFDLIRQLLWEFPEQLSNDISASMPHHLFLRQLLHAQISFQRNVSAGLFREGAILAKQNKTHPLRILFKDKTQLDIEEFLDFLFLTYCAVSQGHKKINLKWYEKCANTSWGQKIIFIYSFDFSNTARTNSIF